MSNPNSIPSAGMTLRLRDGRNLGYAEFGASEGKPLFYFHGHPGSRFEARFLAEQAAQAGVRLIGVDRPGMGLSSYKTGRRLLDWPADVVELADSLMLDRFAVVGLSGGGPYSLACAYKLAHRLTACGIIAGVGHTGPWLTFLAQWVTWLMLPIARRYFRDSEHARNTLLQAARNWVEPDRKALSVPGVTEIMVASLVEALKNGAKGPAFDGVLLGRSWGFRLEEITVPRLYLWQGELDRQVPVSMGRTIARQLGHCQATFYPSEGHISLIVNHRKEIVATLMS